MLTYNTTVPATIGTLKVDCIVEHTTSFNSNVTEHPIENGFVIADHVAREAMTLSLTAIITPTPVSYFRIMGGSNPDRLSEAIAYFEQLWLKGEPVTVTIPSGIYQQMVMTSCPLPRSVKNGFCYQVQLEFKHIIIVSQQTAEVPEQNASAEARGRAGATGTDAGASSQVSIGSGLIVRNNRNYLAMNTNQIDLKNFGQIQTGIEATASRASYSIYRSLGGWI